MKMDMNKYAQLLKQVEKELPLEAEKELRKGANVLKKMAEKNAPKSNREHKNKLSKSFKVDIKGWNAKDLEAHIFNKSKHFHLIERGHVIKNKYGKTLGYKAGTFFFKKTCDNYKLTVSPVLATKFFKKLKRKLNG